MENFRRRVTSVLSLPNDIVGSSGGKDLSTREGICSRRLSTEEGFQTSVSLVQPSTFHLVYFCYSEYSIRWHSP